MITHYQPITQDAPSPIIIKDMEQGSEEWINARLGVVTGSQVNALNSLNFKLKTKKEKKEFILNKKKVKADFVTNESINDAIERHTSSDGFMTYMYQKIAELSTGRCEYVYQTPAMIHGNTYEPIAREEYEMARMEIVEQVGIIYRDNDKKLGFSPDGLVNDDGMIEIKCPKSQNHAKTILEGYIKKEYIEQIQFGLFVTNRKWCDFVSYDPYSKIKKIHVIRIYPDKEHQQKLKFVTGLFTSKLELLMQKLKDSK